MKRVEVTVSLTEGAVELIKGFAAKKGITLEEYCKQAILDHLEDDEDILLKVAKIREFTAKRCKAVGKAIGVIASATIESSRRLKTTKLLFSS